MNNFQSSGSRTVTSVCQSFIQLCLRGMPLKHTTQTHARMHTRKHTPSSSESARFDVIPLHSVAVKHQCHDNLSKSSIYICIISHYMHFLTIFLPYIQPVILHSHCGAINWPSINHKVQNFIMADFSFGKRSLPVLNESHLININE